VDTYDPQTVNLCRDDLPLSWKRMKARRDSGRLERIEVNPRDLEDVLSGVLSVDEAARRNGCSRKTILKRAGLLGAGRNWKGANDDTTGKD